MSNFLEKLQYIFSNLKKILWFPILLLIVSCGTNKLKFPDQPNVVLINVDDLGWRDVGYMGSQYYDTPNIDKLSKEGIVFMQAYAGAANCAPSRANMLTGLWGPRHGVYTVGSSKRGNAKTRKLIPTPNNQIIPDSLYTLGKMFQENGYVTATIGKWHISDKPEEHGFDLNIGGNHRGSPGSNGYVSPFNINLLKESPPGEYLTDRLTKEAMTFIKNNRKSPFFLYLPYYAVHKPLMAKEGIKDAFETKIGGKGQTNATYAAMIKTLDRNVGKLLQTVKNLELEKNTIIIFTSDNGGIREISHQDPLRAGKGSYYEGGIRVPLIIKWPDFIKKAKISEEPVTHLDLFPTLQTIIKSKQISYSLDGNDITPLFHGKSISQRDLFWHFPVYIQAYEPLVDQGTDPLYRTRPGSVIRSGNWKLHEYFENGNVELYNLSKDEGEQNNVAENYPEITKKLYKKLSKWRKRTKAPVPMTPNPLYNARIDQNKQQEHRFTPSNN